MVIIAAEKLTDLFLIVMYFNFISYSFLGSFYRDGETDGSCQTHREAAAADLQAPAAQGAELQATAEAAAACHQAAGLQHLRGAQLPGPCCQRPACCRRRRQQHQTQHISSEDQVRWR